MKMPYLVRWFMPGRRGFSAAVCAGLCVWLTGCLAQKAELVQVSQELDKKISRLDQREKDIQAAIKKLDEQVAQAGTLINEARARALSAIREIREEDQPKIQGKIDESDYKIKTLEARVEDRATKVEQVIAKRAAESDKRATESDKRAIESEKRVTALEKASNDQTTALASMAKAVDGRLEEHDKAAAQAQAQARALSEQIAQLNRALTDFRQALAGLGDKLIQQEQRTNDVVAKLQADVKTLDQRNHDLSARLQTDAKATNDHLDKVTKSVGTVAKTLEAVGAKFVVQEEAQDRRLEDMAKALHAATAQMQSLTHTVTKLQGAGKGAKGKPDGKVNRPASGSVPPVAEPKVEAQSSPPPVESGTGASDQPPVAPVEEPTPTGSSETPAPTPTAAAATPVAASPSVETPQKSDGDRAGVAKAAYERSLQRFKQKDFDGALEGFSDFLTQHPTSKLAPNAQYWIGECYFGKNEYDRAIAAYEQVSAIDPASEKVPAALFKKGLAYLALKDRKKASVALAQVVEVFPKSPEAGKAREKLLQLNQGR